MEGAADILLTVVGCETWSEMRLLVCGRFTDRGNTNAWDDGWHGVQLAAAVG